MGMTDLFQIVTDEFRDEMCIRDSHRNPTDQFHNTAENSLAESSEEPEHSIQAVSYTHLDHQFVQTTANRIIEILPNGSLVDKITTYDEYLASDEMARKRTVFTAQTEDDEN